MESSPTVPEGWEDREWEVGWEGHERAQNRRFAKLPFSQKILWLEEAQELAEEMQVGYRARCERERAEREAAKSQNNPDAGATSG